ncbi:M20/M25/M40 family metallo-hydrolase [Granulicella sp. WH15]|uniref:M20/M25/M40 family metallo-hydrolase n=1 Tax=Granulicella sp. WH15 TaxID=2602070 RepID=UPI002104314B|nr:M20/M25/M40 family metallo-hydrolase [Granulicella sp. WH15]
MPSKWIFPLPALLALSATMSAPLVAQPAAPAPRAAHDYTATRKPELTQKFVDFLSIPNVAADPAGLKKNADFLVEQLSQRGFAAQLLTAPGLPAGTPPVVFGEIKTPGATRTIVLYAHYDGQPVTASEWENGAPFTPVMKQVNGEPYVFARSAGDDKAAIFAQLTALDALKAAHIPLKANIRFVWEGEEEAGSVHLEQILMAHRDLIGGDVWLVCDGPVDQTRQQNVIFGARGDTHMQIVVYGPSRSLHSGHYGNWAPNPAMMLVQLLAGMKDGDGKVLIPHFYEGAAPLGPLEKQALASAPMNDGMLRQELALGHTDGGGKPLRELLNLPTLNINGIASGQTGTHSTNSIPPSAIANLDMRLVVGIDWKVQQQRVIDYVRSQGYYVTSAEPTRAELLAQPKVAYMKGDVGENASRTPMDLPIAADVIEAIKGARGKVILLPTSGGTVPLDAMERAANTKTISVPIANHDDNQHAANENLRMQNMWDGVETMAALIDMK